MIMRLLFMLVRILESFSSRGYAISRNSILLITRTNIQSLVITTQRITHFANDAIL